ncbi:hypothetical protein ACFPT7_19110 [Acidicapsa dinghuensis]|uniref:Uncharacterized protein n=1 Tax=Acidicapsa dinghuensis TaxID=2218256 RepID=A0ABW1EJE1_9BACT|nr:hypothetical protein [Acidicapsa dinghuensis]
MLIRSMQLLGAAMLAGCLTAGAQARIDACKKIDAAAVNAAASAWFGAPVTFTVNSAMGTTAGTCDYATQTPKHIEISIYYAPDVNVQMYGLGQNLQPGESLVTGVGDKAVFGLDNNSGNYKSEKLSILKGKAVMVLTMTLDKKLPTVPKEKLADFGTKQLVPKF